MTDARSDVDRLEAILDAIEEMMLRVPTEELPLDPDEAVGAAQVATDIISRALKADGARRTASTRQAMEAARTERALAARGLPADPAERRKLFEHVAANAKARLLEGFTLAFRDGRDLTDAEVESLLVALEKLGLLDGSGEKE
jgi:hypothetical protein